MMHQQLSGNIFWHMLVARTRHMNRTLLVLLLLLEIPICWAGPDDDIPGLLMPPSPHSGHLDYLSDPADVYRIVGAQGKKVRLELYPHFSLHNNMSLYVFPKESQSIYTAFYVEEGQLVTIQVPLDQNIIYVAIYTEDGAADYDLYYKIEDIVAPTPTPSPTPTPTVTPTPTPTPVPTPTPIPFSAQDMINAILGKHGYTSDYDLNKDGKFDIADVIWRVNHP